MKWHIPPKKREELERLTRENITMLKDWIGENADTITDIVIKSLDVSLSTVPPQTWDNYMQMHEKVLKRRDPLLMLITATAIAILHKAGEKENRGNITPWMYTLVANNVLVFIDALEKAVETLYITKAPKEVIEEALQPTTFAHAYLSYIYKRYEPLIHKLFDELSQ